MVENVVPDLFDGSDDDADPLTGVEPSDPPGVTEDPLDDDDYDDEDD